MALRELGIGRGGLPGNICLVGDRIDAEPCWPDNPSDRVLCSQYSPHGACTLLGFLRSVTVLGSATAGEIERAYFMTHVEQERWAGPKPSVPESTLIVSSGTLLLSG